MEKEENKIKKFWNKFWFIVWKDNSPKGWIISIVFLFILIKFILFPVLTLATGSSLPLAIVESCSMYHDGNLFSNFDKWWERHEEKYAAFDVAKEMFDTFIMDKGFNKGDILLITRPTNIEIGDIIIFTTGQASNPIIHRVIDIQEKNGETIYATIGDNNNQQFTASNNPQQINEVEIRQDQIIGKASFKLAPYVGWVKLIFFEAKRRPSERGGCEER